MDLDSLIKLLPDIIIQGGLTTLCIVGLFLLFSADILIVRLRKSKEE